MAIKTLINPLNPLQRATLINNKKTRTPYISVPFPKQVQLYQTVMKWKIIKTKCAMKQQVLNATHNDPERKNREKTVDERNCLSQDEPRY